MEWVIITLAALLPPTFVSLVGCTDEKVRDVFVIIVFVVVLLFLGAAYAEGLIPFNS